MKKSENQSYNIQSINKHLLNILEADYYIEVGNVDLKALTKLLMGQPVFFREIIYADILNHGIGKITNEEENDIHFQFNYLYALHQKESSSKFILTCGTLNYIDDTGVEKFAPIIVLPLTFNYLKREFVINGAPRINSVLIRYFRKFKILSTEQISSLEALNNEKITSVYDIDQVCMTFGKISNFTFSTTNYLSLMSVEYKDYVEQNKMFEGQRSILEMNDITITNQFFNNVKNIIPTNIEQKYILLKAHNGESLVVDGRLATGKTSTAINMMADFTAMGKKVLYVNQDLDNINDLRRNLKILGLNPYIYDLTKNTWDIDDEEELEVLPFDKFNNNLLNELETYCNIYNEKYHGYTYSYILEQLAISKANNILDIVKIEKILDQEEIKFVYNNLKKIEYHLDYVEPLGSNIWSAIQSGKNSPTAQDIINHTNHFLNETLNIVKILDKFAGKYNLEKITNISNFNRLIEQMVSFINVRPLLVWTEKDFYDTAKIALNNISKYSDIHYNCETYYHDNCASTYEKGKVEKHFKTILNNHFEINDQNSKDAEYVNKLLFNQEHFVSLVEKITKWVKDSLDNYKKIADLFAFETPTKEQFIFLNKLHLLYNTYTVDEAWLKEFIQNPKETYVKAKQVLEEYNTLQSLLSEIEKYVPLKDLITTQLKDLIENKKFINILKKNVNKQELKLNKTNVNKVASLIKSLYQQSELIKHAIPANSRLNIDDEETQKNYVIYLDYIIKLTPFETRTLIYFIKNIIDGKKIKLSSFVETLSRLKENQKELEIIEQQLNEYNFTTTADNFIEVVKQIKAYIPYFEKVIDASSNISNCFKTPENISVYDCLLLIETDKQQKKVKEHFDKNKEKYEHLFGSSYKGVNTQVTDILQSMDYFVEFIKRLKINKNVELSKIYSALLNEKIFTEFINNASTFTNLYSSWFNALRGFSVCFFGGKMNLQNNQFSEIIKIVSEYVDRIDQVEHIYEIEHILDSFYIYGLKDLPDGIHNGKYVKGIAEQYLYSTLNKHYTQMLKEGYKKFNLVDFSKTIEAYKKEESRYCETNISELRNKITTFAHKIKSSTHDVFDEYNLSMIKDAPAYKKIFMCDIDIFNNLTELSFFDLVIIDDAHLSTANKYSNIFNANQVVVFGDRSFKSSVTNTLMQRVKPTSIIVLHKRYFEMNNKLHNYWQKDNRYIYSPNQQINILELSSLHEMIQKAVETYKKHKDQVEKQNINIVVYNPTIRREVYTLLVKELRNEFSIEEVIKITNYNIRITSCNGESMRMCDVVYLWYDDLYELRPNEQEIIRRNYLLAKKEINICTLVSKGAAYAKKKEAIEEFIGPNIEVKLSNEGIIEIIYKRLTKKGINVTLGPGAIDLVINNKNKTIGIIILGKANNQSYSLIDDYLYYVNEYSSRNWNIITYSIEDLYTKLDDVINAIERVIK